MTDEIDLNAILAKATKRPGKSGAGENSEITRRADELRAIAAKCKTINEFRAATGWNMETARHARTVLNLDLPDARLPTGPATAGRAVPKPQSKKAGGK